MDFARKKSTEFLNFVIHRLVKFGVFQVQFWDKIEIFGTKIHTFIIEVSVIFGAKIRKITVLSKLNFRTKIRHFEKCGYTWL